jgi:hypothetical protein
LRSTAADQRGKAADTEEMNVNIGKALVASSLDATGISGIDMPQVS